MTDGNFCPLTNSEVICILLLAFVDFCDVNSHYGHTACGMKAGEKERKRERERDRERGGRERGRHNLLQRQEAK